MHPSMPPTSKTNSCKGCSRPALIPSGISGFEYSMCRFPVQLVDDMGKNFRLTQVLPEVWIPQGIFYAVSLPCHKRGLRLLRYCCGGLYTSSRFLFCY